MKLKLILFPFVFMVGSLFSQDLTISPTIISPTAGCYLSATETVTITVANIGVGTHFGTVVVEYSLDGGPVVSESFGTPIPSGGTYIYSFTVDADMSACMMHTLDFEVIPTTDVNPANNTLSVSRASDCDPIVGSISGPDTVCAGLNSGDLVLTGYTGNINSWAYSTDSVTWTSVANTTDTEPYLDISLETYYFAIVESQFGLCPNDTTEFYAVYVDQMSIGGTLGPDYDICDNANGDTLDLTGYFGDVTNWEYSDDGGTTWNNITNTSDQHFYSNLPTTTLFFATVQNGVCPAVNSDTITLNLIPGSDAGTVLGENLVCNFENDSFLTAAAYNGVVTDWIYSSDTGATYLSSGVSTDTYDYSGLLGYTIYGVIVQEGACPPDTAYHTITVLPINISAGPDVTIFEGDSTLLTGSGGVGYYWFPDSFLSVVDEQNTWASPEETTTYYLEVTDASGCKDTANVIVTVLPGVSELIIPNLITPNGDGFNDNWYISQLEAFTNNELYIFNDMGQIIYQAQPYNNDWYGTFNGENLPDGTYFYLLRLNDDLLEINEYQGVITIVGND